MADTTIAGLPLNETFEDADVFERERDLSGTPGSVRGTLAGLVAWLKTKITPVSIGAIAGAGTVTDDEIVAFDGTSGLAVKGAGLSASGVASELIDGYDHRTDTSTNPHAVTAAQVGAIPVVSGASGGEVALLTSGGEVTAGPAFETLSYQSALSSVVTTSPVEIGDSAAGLVARISSASNALSIEIDDTMIGADAADTYAFSCTLIVTDVTNPITFATGAGLLTPVFYGASTITAVSTLIAITVANGVAMVAIVEPV